MMLHWLVAQRYSLYLFSLARHMAGDDEKHNGRLTPQWNCNTSLVGQTI
jgi:hypothetical protein